MPTLAESVRAIDTSMLERVEPNQPTPTHGLPSSRSTISNFNVCPLPLVAAFPDSLRQFNRDNVPQYRIIPVHGLELG